MACLQASELQRSAEDETQNERTEQTRSTVNEIIGRCRRGRYGDGGVEGGGKHEDGPHAPLPVLPSDAPACNCSNT